MPLPSQLSPEVAGQHSVNRFMWKDSVGVSGQDAGLTLWIQFHLHREMRLEAEQNENQCGEQRGRKVSSIFLLRKVL